MNAVDRLAAACLATAARRWPEELSGEMLSAWRAELAALQTEPGRPAAVRAWHACAFVVSLACSPAVEAAGEPERTRHDRIATAGRTLVGLTGAVGVVLLAAALFDLVHVVNHALGPRIPFGAALAAGVLLLAGAATVMARIGALAGRRFPARRATVYVAAIGAVAYGFFLAGNRVKVMPFMGWIDIAPGVTAWTLLTIVVVGSTARLAAAGRRSAALVTGAGGSVVALAVSAVCASLHAAAQLEVRAGSAPAWFVLALLPGGRSAIGVPTTVSPDEPRADAGCCPGTWNTSDVLLGNLSAMAGPLLLCSVFVLALALRAARVAPAPAAAPVDAGAARRTLGTRAVAGCAVAVLLLVPTPAGAASLGGVPLGLPLRAMLVVLVVALARFDGSARRLRQVGIWLVLAAGAALLSLAVGEALRGEDRLTAALARFGDNSTVFGFGFLATGGGQLALAVTLGVLAARWAVAPDDARSSRATATTRRLPAG